MYLVRRYDIPYVVQSLYIIVGNSKEDIDKTFEFKSDHTSIVREVDTWDAYTVIGACNKESNEQCVCIILNKEYEDKELINTCAHEATHVCLAILNASDIDPTNEATEEVYAYLCGFITEKAYTTYKESKKNE